jgi:hypothetical protein
MRLIINIEKTLKNGMYLDFIFKNLIFFFYKKIISKNFLFLMDKHFTEYIFFMYKSFCNYFFFIIDTYKNLKFNEILKVILVLTIQLTIIIIL